MAIYKTEHGGITYSWVEKGKRACLIRDETRLLWVGDPCDPVSLRKLDAPLEVLLVFSVLRGVDRG